MKKLTLFLSAFLLLCSGVSLAQQVTPFKDGDRVAFIGNSITDGGRYHSFIWLYYMTRFPDTQVTMFNCGIGGDTAADMFKRLDGDVFSRNPNVITLTFGMNDSGYYEYNGDNAEAFGNSKVAASEESFRKIEERFKKLPDTRFVMIGGSPYDETAKIKDNTVFRNKNKAMDRIVAIQKATAQTNGWQFVDFSAPMVALNAQNQKADSTFTLCGQDRIHPDNDGHMVMAYLFLKSQGFADKCVADFAVDARKKAVAKAENCKIDNINVTSKGVSFDYLAEALPYPLDTTVRGWGARKSQAAATKVVPFIEQMNREMLCVSGLKGKYELAIDGEVLGIFAGDELGRGINLALYPWTPQYQQALAIMTLNEERWEIERRMRDNAWVQFGFFQQHGKLDANDRSAIELYDSEMKNNMWLGAKRDLYSKTIHPQVREAWQKQQELLVSMIYEINAPKSRHITLRSLK